MATTTTRIVISSTDLLSAALTVDNTSTLTQAGGSTAIAQTTGLAATLNGGTSIYTIYAKGSYNDDEAAKVYIKNKSTNATHYVLITIEGTTVGRLYAGDWALIPWDTTGDFKCTNSDATISIEHMLFHEG